MALNSFFMLAKVKLLTLSPPFLKKGLEFELGPSIRQMCLFQQIFTLKVILWPPEQADIWSISIFFGWDYYLSESAIMLYGH